MFRTSLCRMICSLFLLVMIPSLVHAQMAQMYTQELKDKAGELFEKGSYAEAYEVYSELISRYPEDGMFNYYAGICLLKEGTKLPEAVEHLELAASKTNTPGTVYYYLGIAYRENYRFRESIIAFRKFSDQAKRSEIKEYNPELEASVSSNAIELTSKYNPFDILASSLFSFSDSGYVKQVRGKGGILNIKPADLWSKDEKQGDLSNYMFMPKSLHKGDYVFISGYSRKEGLELYRVKKLNGKSWSDPQEIEQLNSDCDEIMPYFDPISKDLYFASNGHKSMGGFDVFKSHYDEERDVWSEPVNLGFPVNSPVNDYLVIPGSDLGTLLVITDRQGMDSMLTVYKLHLQEPKKSLADADADEIRKIGNLGGIEAIPAIVDMRKEDEMVSESRMNNKETKNSRPHINKGSGKTASDPYQKDLNSAMAYQVTSDSLSQLAKNARIRVKNMSDPNERWTLQKKIISWEKQSADFQEKADQLYADMKNKKEKAEKTLPHSIEKDTVINNITVYRYRDEKSKEQMDKEKNEKKEIANVAREVFKTKDEPGTPVQTAAKEPESFSRFVILEKSPYNENNPFPELAAYPDGAFYRIQLGVFSQPKKYNAFGGISPITIEKIKGKNLIRYYAGKFNHYEEASQALEKIKQNGYPDAFIVSWYDGQRTSTNRVMELEKRDR